MENTLENKAKFFAQYWGQEVCRIQNGRLVKLFGGTIHSMDLRYNFLELKSLSYITDEDAIAVAKIFAIKYEKFKVSKEMNYVGDKPVHETLYVNITPNKIQKESGWMERFIAIHLTKFPDHHFVFAGNVVNENRGLNTVCILPTVVLEIVDYLHSKGYALPWMGLPVEKQIEYGWIKIKN